ncbi:Sushi domain-containing protein 3 [Varanus komodoensis]|nr:Sushi domain-containing protein 3 [Varanus komodoensis]
MKKQRCQVDTAFYLLVWSCLEFTLSDTLESSAAATSGGETGIKTFLRETANGTAAQANLSVQCTTLFPPSHGFYFIAEGSGSNLGSVITYWCKEGYQLVGNGKLTCLLKGSISYWSHSPPHCEVIPKPQDKGFRVAVIASLISGVIIVTMLISFAVCCLRDRMLKETARNNETAQEQPPRRKFKVGRANSVRQETGKSRSHFGKMRHNRRLQYRTSALYSWAHPGALAGCSSQGFQRNLENLQKGAPQSLCSEIHIFPQVVLKPGTIPSASMFVHLPQKADVPLNVKPCYSNLPPGLPSVYYRRFEGLGHLNKC